MKRFPPAFVFMLFVCASAGAVAQSSSDAAPTCADLHLVPAPRECTAVASIHIGESGVSVSAGSDAEDAFAADDLEHAIAGDGVVVGSGRTAAITLLRADSPSAKALLTSHHLQFDPAMHDEGYAIAPDGAHG